jgi:glutamate--cysteine ligase
VGWEIIASEGENIFELKRGDANITLEGDGRIELAGSPQVSLHDLARELRLHANEIVEIGNIFNITWLSLGLQPFHSNDQLQLLPRERYTLLQGVGDTDLMATMTKRTNGITANLSYLDAENAVKKAQTAFRVLPVIGAIFASSPFSCGKPSGYLDERRSVIMNHAPKRTDIPRNILDENFTMDDWFDFYLDLPVILITTPSGYIKPSKPLSFREWMVKGYEGTTPTFQQFDDHVKTTWSDMRLRPSYLEYRVPDSVPTRFAMAIPALMKGLLFDSSAWKLVKELTKDWTYDEILALDRTAWKEGLQATIHGTSLLSIAQKLILIASENLHKFARLDGNERDETIFLSELKEQIYIKEKSPSEELLFLYNNDWNHEISHIVAWGEAEGNHATT